MARARGDEPRGGRAEHELEHLAALAAHPQPPALVVHARRPCRLEAAAEVRDARPRADARNAVGRDRARLDASARRAMTRPPLATDTLPAMRRTKIVATIGPASREPDTLLRMVEAGMDVARLNYSHGTLEEHAETVAPRARRGRARGAPGGDPAGPARPEAADRPAARGHRRAQARRAADVHLRRRGARGRRHAHEHLLGGPARRGRATDAVLYLADGSVRLRVVGGARRRARGRRRGRGRRRRRLAPGPEHPRPRRRRCRRCPRRTSSCCATASRSAWTWSRCRSCSAPRTSNPCASTRACR